MSIHLGVPMSNIQAIQGTGYTPAAVDTSSSATSAGQGGGFSYTMGQVSAAGSGNSLTPPLAQTLMYRSMTTGVPTAELEQYGGYSAVKAMFDANGGSYSLDAIPVAQRHQLAQQVASTGVGNSAILLGAAPATLTPSAAQSLMQRSMTTGVPKSEMDQYGGYEAVKAMFDAGAGSYSVEAIPAEERKALAQQVASTGVGNMSLAVAEQIGLSSTTLAAMANNGIDQTTLNKLAEQTSTFEPAPFVDSYSYISTFMSAIESK